MKGVVCVFKQEFQRDPMPLLAYQHWFNEILFYNNKLRLASCLLGIFKPFFGAVLVLFL